MKPISRQRASHAKNLRAGAILIDCPWSFVTYGNARITPHRTAVDHYETMDFASLKKLPIRRLAANDCALFMWVVDSHFDEALKLAKAWGFKFVTCAFIWVKIGKDGKPRMSLGYWSRKQTEQCWLFTRGKPRRIGKGVRQRYPGWSQALGDQSGLMNVGRVAPPPPVTGPLIDLMLS